MSEEPRGTSRSPIGWRDAFPKAQLGGLQSLRTVLLPGPGQQNEVAWQVTLDRRAEEPHHVLTGEIAVDVGQLFTIVTVGSALVFAPGDEHDRAMRTDPDELLETYGPWAAHVLWDFATTVLKAAVAGVMTPAPINIPALTPQPVLVTQAMRREWQATAEAQ